VFDRRWPELEVEAARLQSDLKQRFLPASLLLVTLSTRVTTSFNLLTSNFQ
jgi:hypothetical protein